MSSERELQAALRDGPFHVAFRAAVESRGLTLDRLRHRLRERGLRVGTTSLSYWQQGLRRPERAESLRAVRALEEILTLPPRSLTDLLGPPRPRGRGTGLPPGAVGYATILDAAPDLSALLRELDWTADDRRLHIAAMYETVRIGADRSIIRRETLQVLRAHEDAADRHITIYRGDTGCDVDRVRIRALEDCRLGRIRRHGPSGLVAAELLFDRELRTGDTQVVRYDLIDPSGMAGTEYERGFRFPAGQYTLRVCFDPVALPVRIHGYTRRGPAAGENDRRELTLNAHHAVHLMAESIRPGLVGIRWDWPS
ncbi:hypothetical protein ACFHYQ_21080 [Sphaerimonospora cavernae]|uniref:XRE family transcriptional regulator n=1 Tax=Sphaerimonospora cavernae TaxID=1740611 RepID=A0ABV6U9E2_9ACTN